MQIAYTTLRDKLGQSPYHTQQQTSLGNIRKQQLQQTDYRKKLLELERKLETESQGTNSIKQASAQLISQRPQTQMSQMSQQIPRVEQLEDTIRSLTSEILILREKIKEQSDYDPICDISTLQTIESESQNLKLQINSLLLKVKSTQDSLDFSELENTRLRKQFDQLNLNFQIGQEKEVQLKDEIYQLQATLKQYQQNIDLDKLQTEALKTQQQKYMAQIDILNQQSKKLADKIKIQQQDIEDQAIKISKQLHELQTVSELLKQSNIQKEQQREEYNNNVKAINVNLDNNIRELLKLKSVDAQLQATKKELQKCIEDNTQLSKKAHLCQQLETTVEELNVEKNQLKNELATESNVKTQLLETIKQQETYIQSIEKLMKDRQEAIQVEKLNCEQVQSNYNQSLVRISGMQQLIDNGQQELSVYKNDLLVQSRQISALEQQLAQQKADNEHLQLQYEASNKQFTESYSLQLQFEQEVKLQKQLNEQQELQSQQEKQRIIDLEAKLSAKAEILTQKQLELDSSLQQINELTSELGTSQQFTISSQKQFQAQTLTLKTTIDSQTDQIQSLKLKVKQTSNTLEQSQQANADLRKTNSGLKNDIESLKTNLDETKTVLKQTQIQKTTLNQKVSKLSEQVQQLQIQINDLNEQKETEILNKKQKEVQLEKIINEKEEIINRLMKNLEDNEIEKQQLQEEKEEQNKVISRQMTQIQTQEQQLTEQMQLLKQTEKEQEQIQQEQDEAVIEEAKTQQIQKETEMQENEVQEAEVKEQEISEQHNNAIVEQQNLNPDIQETIEKEAPEPMKSSVVQNTVENADQIVKPENQTEQPEKPIEEIEQINSIASDIEVDYDQENNNIDLGEYHDSNQLSNDNPIQEDVKLDEESPINQ
ncbi:Hypothetical_protein [Hexamita inflata]|uniref:Hypothetical_protein n=1 Tax=Hexamita inflata TaxID=28002 RepID=A0AA86UBL7_9EUKA|nr:Hypothetical protein HINF_LOCUS39030 [Hexamita inflata]